MVQIEGGVGSEGERNFAAQVNCRASLSAGAIYVLALRFTSDFRPNKFSFVTKPISISTERISRSMFFPAVQKVKLKDAI